MEKDLAQGAVGSLGKYDLAIKDKQLIVEVDGAAGPASVGLIIKLDLAQVKKAIEDAIPGPYDNLVLDGIFTAILGA